jgi:hypothetical protein
VAKYLEPNAASAMRKEKFQLGKKPDNILNFAVSSFFKIFTEIRWQVLSAVVAVFENCWVKL